MPRIFIKTFTVPEEAIDVNRHVNNLAYLRWMQDVAIEHSAARGWPMQRYLETGTGWVVRSHFIEYLKPAFQGETLALLTWVADVRRQSSRRRYLFHRPSDGAAIAKAETNWVYVSLKDGRPRPIDDEMRRTFEIVPDDEDVLRSAGLGGTPA